MGIFDIFDEVGPFGVDEREEGGLGGDVVAPLGGDVVKAKSGGGEGGGGLGGGDIVVIY
jgi:hypothetical protein